MRGEKMSIEILFDDFKPLVHHHYHFIQRFQCPDEFCIAFIRPEKQELFNQLKEVIKEALRSTDLFTEKDGSIFLILPGASKKGAEFITKAIYDFFNGEVLEVYVDYPYDAKNPDELIQNLIKETENKFGYLLGKYFR
jgi:hypothetical protein